MGQNTPFCGTLNGQPKEHTMTQIIINSPTDSSLSIMLPLNADGSVVFPKWLIDDMNLQVNLPIEFVITPKRPTPQKQSLSVQDMAGRLQHKTHIKSTIDEMNDSIAEQFGTSGNS